MSGRGRGRGRGRGSGRVGPIIRDDDGKVVFAKKLEGPPPLYPILETLPERPDITQKENTYLVEKRRLLHTFWNESAYYIELVKDNSSRVDGDIRQTSRKPLALYLQLTSAFFPAELIGHERKRKRNNQEGMWTLQNSAKSDLGRLDKLASLEQKIGQKGEKDEGEKKEGEEDEEDQDATFEEDEEDIVEDDYMANFGFDDDDEYDDDDGGGEDEGPTY